MRFFIPLLAIFLTAGCSSAPKAASSVQEAQAPEPTLVPGSADAPSQVTPREAMAIAQAYASHRWQPFASNILHGKDPAGILVNTPDIGHDPAQDRRGWWVPGQVNEGMPYKWGGYDDPASFNEAVARGLAAGDISSPAKRQADNAGVSAMAAGVDCSGFVSRCLKLPRGYDTSQLPAICRPLANARELQPGDILNIPRRHVLLCAGWVDADRKWIFFYETGGAPDYWKPGLKQAPLGALLALGYQPLRYTGMATETVPDGKQPREVLTRAVKKAAVRIEEPTVGEP
jgi:cell wall-associated NlpC family hydrolase